MKSKKIETLEELKQLAFDNHLECFVVLGGGGLRSSKNIFYQNDRWEIYNEVDGSLQSLLTRNLSKKTNIIKAIEAGCLYQYIWED